MKLEEQVVNLELSKRLKELGVKQESLFYWSKLSIQLEYKLEMRRHVETGELILADCTDYISAFTASELLEMLPKEIQGDEYELGCNFSNKMNYVFYYFDNEISDLIEQDENLANALAKMLIHLIENKLVDIIS